MSEQKILVIDDSKTIRRLCDSELSAAGYVVLLAPTAEEGVEAAATQAPDLIILDHQLPGTTGYEVCVQLLANPETAKIPVVASSTLRKKAYAEYVDCDNVVDMLPKPYSPDALIATVENALNTAAMVVQSQYEGSAVPEVINELGEASIAGEFGCFGLREIIDLLNNGSKTGSLEVEIERARVFVFVSNGRIQAITASGISPETIAQQMPEALSELAPIIKFTLAGRKGSEINGLVELLNNKVLDPRLLKKLLRLQAAILLRTCFASKLKSFRFNQSDALPTLFEKLPLEGSLLGLVVEGCLICDVDEVPHFAENVGFVRRTLRGQNLDRAGLSSRHMRLMNVVAEPVSVSQIASQLGWSDEEVRRVAAGFEMAELIEQTEASTAIRVFGVVSDTTIATHVSGFFQANSERINGRVVRDLLALRLLLRRARPDVLVLQSSDDIVEFLNENQSELSHVKVVGVGVTNATGDEPFDVVIEGDCTLQQLADTFGHLAQQTTPAAMTLVETSASTQTTEV
jgi:CheY-like chemotaxis protein